MSAVKINVVVEGNLDEYVVRKIIHFCNPPLKFTIAVLVKNGKEAILKKIKGYNEAAKTSLWFVLVDLDRDNCPPELVNTWFKDVSIARFLCFRVAVREIEAWLLADRKNIARFLCINEKSVPNDPETIPDPKREIIDLAKRSRKRYIRQGIVPNEISYAREGPAYSSILAEFVSQHWDVNNACKQSPSLLRTIQCLQQKIQTYIKQLPAFSS